MKGNIQTFLSKLPIMLGIIFVIFLMFFSLDVFEPGLTIDQIIIGLLVHNIPAFFLSFVLLISRRNEKVAGIMFIFAGLLYILSLWMNPKFEWYMVSWSVLIAGPAFLIGFLFIVNWNKKKSKSISFASHKRDGEVKTRSL